MSRDREASPRGRLDERWCMVVFFSNSEDAAADARADVLDELLVAHLALATGVVEVDNLDGFVFAHR